VQLRWATVTANNADLSARKPHWLVNASTRVADWTQQKFSNYRG
jgi:hypothetical protein